MLDPADSPFPGAGSDPLGQNTIPNATSASATAPAATSTSGLRLCFGGAGGCQIAGSAHGSRDSGIDVSPGGDGGIGVVWSGGGDGHGTRTGSGGSGTGIVGGSGTGIVAGSFRPSWTVGPAHAPSRGSRTVASPAAPSSRALHQRHWGDVGDVSLPQAGHRIEAPYRRRSPDGDKILRGAPDRPAQRAATGRS
ncbi:hypothetical protein GCM10010182_47530 [Actinomadura cremea]|nr:hypothetical protein GCM10010182_47530 [Actinomadura cremea]